MVHQADVNTNGKSKRAEPNVAASFSELTHDAIELAELQAQLLKLDVQTAVHNTGISLRLMIVGACLLLGCVPVALTAIAELLIAQAGWSRAASFAAAAAIGLVLSAAAGAPAWRRVQQALAALRRSSDEFNRNLAWIKTNLKRDKSSRYVDRLD